MRMCASVHACIIIMFVHVGKCLCVCFMQSPQPHGIICIFIKLFFMDTLSMKNYLQITDTILTILIPKIGTHSYFPLNPEFVQTKDSTSRTLCAYVCACMSCMFVYQ